MLKSLTLYQCADFVQQLSKSPHGNLLEILSSILNRDPNDGDVYDYENATANPVRYSDFQEREVVPELRKDIEQFSREAGKEDIMTVLDTKDLNYF